MHYTSISTSIVVGAEFVQRTTCQYARSYDNYVNY